jgi:hypothetical protein
MAGRHDFNEVEIAVAQPQQMVGRLWHLGINLLIIYVLERVYEFGRGLVPKQQVLALHNGLFVVQLEQSWHIFDEWHLQAIVFRHRQWLIGPLTINRDQLISVINHFYLYSHFLGTLFFLAWVFLFRHHFFGLVRDIIFISTGLALIIYIAFPMMPPRLMGSALHLPHGYRIIDTIAPILNYKLQQAQLGYNPYAAMPSLHFAWALILGVTLMLIGGHWPIRIFGLLYPLMMLATIVISGNHLWLDAAGSVIVVTIAAAAAGLWHLRGTPWSPHRLIGNRQAA